MNQITEKLFLLAILVVIGFKTATAGWRPFTGNLPRRDSVQSYSSRLDQGRSQPREPDEDRSSSTSQIPMQISRPLTLRLCRRRNYRKLRTCKMALKEEKAMAHASNKYLCGRKDRWEDTSQTEQRHISKRAVRHGGTQAINQCSGTPTKKVILQAYEAESPHRIRELLQDPENFLYQTHFVETCQRYGPFQGFQCRMHTIRFKAAVWSIDEDSDEISVIDVITEGYCALSQV